MGAGRCARIAVGHFAPTQEPYAFQERRRPLGAAGAFEEPVPTVRREAEVVTADGVFPETALGEVRPARLGFRRGEEALVKLFFGPGEDAIEIALVILGPRGWTTRFAVWMLGF